MAADNRYYIHQSLHILICSSETSSTWSCSTTSLVVRRTPASISPTGVRVQVPMVVPTFQTEIMLSLQPPRLLYFHHKTSSHPLLGQLRPYPWGCENWLFSLAPVVVPGSGPGIFLLVSSHMYWYRFMSFRRPNVFTSHHITMKGSLKRSFLGISIYTNHQADAQYALAKGDNHRPPGHAPS